MPACSKKWVLALLPLILLLTGVSTSAQAAIGLIENNSGKPLQVLDGATGQPVTFGGVPWTVAPGASIYSHPWGSAPQFCYQGDCMHYIGSVNSPTFFRFFLVDDWPGQPSGSVLESAGPATPYQVVTNTSGRELPVLEGATGAPVEVGGRPVTIAPGAAMRSHQWGAAPRYCYAGACYHYIGSVGSPSFFRYFLVPAEDDGLTEVLPGADAERPGEPPRRIQVWTHGDEAQRAGSDQCMDLLEALVAVTDRNVADKRAATCTLGTALFRLRFAQDTGGIRYLARVELLVYLASRPASNVPPEGISCREWENLLLPANRPVSEAVAKGTCWQDALPRGHVHQQVIGTWSEVPLAAQAPEFPEDIHCWQVTRYLGAPRGVEGRPVKCVYN